MNALSVHPLALAIPEMLRDEYVELVADIKRHGLKQPIVIFEGKILDGRHRDRACRELGIEPSVIEFAGNSDDAKSFVLSLNVHRRHLTLAQKEKIVVAELKRDPTQSDRSIGRKANVDHKTVAKARTKAVDGGEIPHHAKRVGVDGVEQPAKKAKLTLRERQGLPPAPPKPPTPKVIAEQVGVPELAPILEELDAQLKKVAYRPEDVGALAERLEPLLKKLFPDGLPVEHAAIVDELRYWGRAHRAASSPSAVTSASFRLKKLLATPAVETTKPAPTPTSEAEEDAAVLARAEREGQAAIREAVSLPESTAREIERVSKRMLNAWHSAIRPIIRKRVNAALADKTKDLVDALARPRAEELTKNMQGFYQKQTAEAKAAKEEYRRLASKLDRWMTQEEFRLVLGCLHPDKPDRSPESLAKAFQIFKRLEHHVSETKREQKANGWTGDGAAP